MHFGLCGALVDDKTVLWGISSLLHYCKWITNLLYVEFYYVNVVIVLVKNIM